MFRTTIYMMIAFIASACQSASQKNIEMEHEHTNELIHETSPYLLQHAHNPVDWNAWHEEVIKESIETDKLIIISIGYSACHWCHVMEHESFEDSTVAAIMNEHFINIKVDREERPDIDDVYMTACQLSSGKGCGWPLNAFALPGGRPIWAGTYFPKDQWMNILTQFVKLKQESPERLEEFAKNLEAGFQSVDAVPVNEADADLANIDLVGAMRIFKGQIDRRYGGRNGAPKFPMPNNYELLLRWSYTQQDEKAKELVYTTLDNMAQSGLFDPVVGGFARYSTDAQWKVPHFEKMLYDNGQLLDIYSQGYKASGNPLYQLTIDKTINWLATEMTDKSGGIYSALDADSEGEEGKFYVWTYDELHQVLNDGPDFDIFKARYEITTSGNWEHGNNILHSKKSMDELASKFDLSEEEIQNSIEASLKMLKTERDKRIRPGLDDKILTSWNALAAHGLIEAHFATGNKTALELAEKNIQFLTTNQLNEDGRLWRNYKEGKSSINAFLDDYALVIRALLRYYELTFDEQHLMTADQLTRYAIDHFSDDSTALFYYTSDIDPPLVTRKRELSDNVISSSNSIMARNLLHLGLYLYNNNYVDRAHAMAVQMKASIFDNPQPSFYSNWMQLYMELDELPYEVAIVGNDALDKAREWKSHYVPNALLLGGKTEGNLELLKDKLQDGSTFIYVCRNKVCKFPVEEIEAALQLIE